MDLEGIQMPIHGTYHLYLLFQIVRLFLPTTWLLSHFSLFSHFQGALVLLRNGLIVSRAASLWIPGDPTIIVYLLTCCTCTCVRCRQYLPPQELPNAVRPLIQLQRKSEYTQVRQSLLANLQVTTFLATLLALYSQ